jgi:hypothetical protein
VQIYKFFYLSAISREIKHNNKALMRTTLSTTNANIAPHFHSLLHATKTLEFLNPIFHNHFIFSYFALLYINKVARHLKDQSLCRGGMPPYTGQ